MTNVRSARKELEGKTAIVTGASRGIGRAIAQAFFDAGASVVLTGRDPGRGDAALREVSPDGQRAMFVVADQASDSDWTRVVDAALTRFGRLDVLAANAGVSSSIPTADMPLTEFRKLNAVNLKGVFLGLKHATAAIRRHTDGGAIVLVASVVGKIGAPGFMHYTASKGGVRLMAKAAALELGPEKIRVNSIHPGFVRTDLSAQFDEKQLAPLVPLGRFGEPKEIGDAALFLACPRSCFITGAELVVDGGWTVQ